MADIVFDTGLVEYTINGKVKLVFNPTDPNFIEKLFNTFDGLDELQTHYANELEKVKSNKEAFRATNELDAEMRKAVDDALGDGICDQLFGTMNLYATADGLPVWCNLILAIMDEMHDSVAREKKATNPRIAKYTAKYKK